MGIDQEYIPILSANDRLMMHNREPVERLTSRASEFVATTGELLERLQQLCWTHSVRIDVRTLLTQVRNGVGIAQNDHVIRQQPQIKYICVLKFAVSMMYQ